MDRDIRLLPSSSIRFAISLSERLDGRLLRWIAGFLYGGDHGRDDLRVVADAFGIGNATARFNCSEESGFGARRHARQILCLGDCAETGYHCEADC